MTAAIDTWLLYSCVILLACIFFALLAGVLELMALSHWIRRRWEETE